MASNNQTLHFDLIIPNLNSTNSKQVLQKLAEQTSNLIGTPKKIVYENLVQQEQDQSAGIGHGVVISHMQLPRLTRPLTILAKLDKAIYYNSLDREPVDLICLVMSPEHEKAQHLNRLAMVSRNFNNINFCNKLRDAKDKEDIQIIVRELNNNRIAA